MEIRKRAFDDVLPKSVDPGRWLSDVLYGWQRILLTRSCMRALQPHRPRSLRLASFELLKCSLTTANGDYNQLVSCLTDTDPVIQEKAKYTLYQVHIFTDEGFCARIRDQLIAIIRQSDQLIGLYDAALFLDDNEAIRPELYAWLEDEDSAFRMLACYILDDEDESGANIPVLTALVANSPDNIWPITGHTFREEGFSLLYGNQLHTPGVLAELVKALEDPNEDLQLQVGVIHSLGTMGSSALPALESLVAKLHHPNREVQGFAIEAIAAIGPEAHRAVPHLLSLVDGEQYGLGGGALEAAIRIDPNPDRLADLLFDMLPEAAPYNRTALYRAMKWFDVTDDHIVSTLRQGLDDTHPEARAAAVESLGFINPTSPDIISTLITGLDDADEKVRLASVAALVKHPMCAEKTVPLLRSMLANDEEEKVRAAVAKALGSIAGDQDTIETLINAIQDDDPYVRRAAILALGTIGPNAKAAIPSLQSLLGRDRPNDWFIDEANAALELIERRESTDPDS